MKKNLILAFMASALLLTGCQNNQNTNPINNEIGIQVNNNEIHVPVSPSYNVLFAFFTKCVEGGYATVFNEPQSDRGEVIFHCVLEEKEYYFYAVPPYKFVKNN